MSGAHILRAGGELAVNLDPMGDHWRVQWGESDWFGPLGFGVSAGGRHYRGAGAPWVPGAEALSPTLVETTGADDLGAYAGFTIGWSGLPLPVRTHVRAYVDLPLVVFRLEAAEAIAGLGSGAFEAPTVAWPTFIPALRDAGGVPPGTTSYGHAYCEFATPATSDAACGTFQRPGHRPPIVEPLLLIAPDGRTLLLGPLNAFHDQIIAVPDGADRVAEGIRCGWHGDLATVPGGFATELALYACSSPRAVLAEWAALLLERAETRRRGRYADDGVGKLSYWTDNGGVYYYRTDPDTSYSETLRAVVEDLHSREVPIRSVQIDSWFYPQEIPRPVSPEGAPVVPPSGMLTWDARDDVFPEGLTGLRAQLGNLPLTFHSRHFASTSPYFEHYAHWADGAYAHPSDPAMYDTLMASAANWGAMTYEQDWLVEAFLAVRGLREAPGRAADWQVALDRAAGAHGLTLQWCMATPADFLQTVALRNVTSIRTSGDYRYVFDNGLNWVYFLHTNALARALQLTPYKDVFISHADTEFGEPYAEVEALIAALSSGPVGIGDKRGHTNREIVMRTCREDGVLIKPDVPLAALSRCFHAHAFFDAVPLIGETYSRHPAGDWIYVTSFNASAAKVPLTFRVALADLGDLCPTGPVIAYNWRTGETERLEPGDGWDLSLAWQDWDFRVLCPLLPGEMTVFGDVGKYATAGDRRIANIAVCGAGFECDVVGAPDTWAEVCGYAAERPAAVAAGFPVRPAALAFQARPDPAVPSWRWDAGTRRWTARVWLGQAGRTRLRVHAPAKRR